VAAVIGNFFVFLLSSVVFDQADATLAEKLSVMFAFLSECRGEFFWEIFPPLERQDGYLSISF
jgi:hypothetical protein